MTSSPLLAVHPYVIAIGLMVLGTNTAHAQLASGGSANEQIAQLGPGQGVEIIGQPPGSGTSSIIGSPVPERSGSMLGLPSVLSQPTPGQDQAMPGLDQAIPRQERANSRPSYPGTNPHSSMERNVVQEKLNRANREAADIDRDGRISPEEASRLPAGPMPPGERRGAPLPGTSLPRY
jgi:hypothetical protein